MSKHTEITTTCTQHCSSPHDGPLLLDLVDVNPDIDSHVEIVNHYYWTQKGHLPEIISIHRYDD